MDQHTLLILGGMLAAAIAVTPVVMAILAVGYWAGTKKAEVDALTKGLQQMNHTLVENLRELKATQHSHGERLAALEGSRRHE